MRASPPRQFTAPPAIHNAGSFVSRKPSVHRSRSGALVSVTHQWRWRASGCSRRRLVGQAGAKEPERSPSAGDSSFGFLSGSQRGREGGKSAAGGAETGYQPEIDVSLLFGEEERSRLQFERNVDQLVRVLRTQAPRPGSASRNGQTATNVHTPYRASRPVLDASGRLQVLNGGPPAANDSVTTTTAASRSPPVLEWEPAPHSRPLSIWWFVTRLAVAASLANTRWTYGVVGSAEALERRQRNRRRAIAAWVRESLLALGPTFIKVGQFFSARSDLFPAEVIEELSQLQDSVPAFDVAEARRIFQRQATGGGLPRSGASGHIAFQRRASGGESATPPPARAVRHRPASDAQSGRVGAELAPFRRSIARLGRHLRGVPGGADARDRLHHRGQVGRPVSGELCTCPVGADTSRAVALHHLARHRAAVSAGHQDQSDSATARGRFRHQARRPTRLRGVPVSDPRRRLLPRRPASGQPGGGSGRDAHLLRLWHDGRDWHRREEAPG
eukprot:ctg_2267.g606